MIVTIGNKTRQIIKARILDDGLRRQLRMLARWGASQTLVPSDKYIMRLINK